MKRTLPVLPCLKQQRNLAKDLLKDWKSSRPDAFQRIREAHPRFGSFKDAELKRQPFKLADAQLVLAREYGFASWQKLKNHVTRITGDKENEKVLSLVRAVAERRHSDVRKILKVDPSLTRLDIASSNEHRALHFAVRNRDTEMVRLLLDAGAEPSQGVYPFREATNPRTLAADRGHDEILVIFEEYDEKKRKEARCPNLTVTPAIADVGQLIREGRDDEVMVRIAADPGLLDSCDRQGETVVHHAARWGRDQLLEKLIAAGAHTNKMNVNGDRALDLAVLHPGSHDVAPGCRRASAILLKQKDLIITLPTAVAMGDLKTVNEAAKTQPERFARNTARKCGLLQTAVRHNQLAMLKLLLDLGCDPDDKHRIASLAEEAYDKAEPLWIAAGESQYDFARVLLDYGADPNLQHYGSGDPISRAYNNRDQKMVELLAKRGANVDPVTASFEGDDTHAIAGIQKDPTLLKRVLWGAVHGGSPELVRHCLACVKSSAIDDIDWYDLLWSTMNLWRCMPHRKFRDFDRSKYFDIFTQLLKAGADPNAKGPWNITPLHQTVFSGCCWGQVLSTPEERSRFATLLLDAGAVLDAKDDEILSTPLGWAAREGRVELVQLFLDRGASTNLPDDEPWATPLAWAEKKGHKKVSELLRKAGARK